MFNAKSQQDHQLINVEDMQLIKEIELIRSIRVSSAHQAAKLTYRKKAFRMGTKQCVQQT